MHNIDLETKNANISGYCDPDFQPVLDAFVQNFESRSELGANICINHQGETKVDLWGGYKSPGKDAPGWEQDTVSIIFSCTKAATALCAHLLIDQEKMDLHAPVTTYWPEFGVNGKQDATVEMMLNHSVGLPALREPVKQGGYCDWDYMVERLANEAPFWPPGTRNGYHMITYGWTVGELVRRVSGLSLGEYFQQNIAQPLGLDFWIGMPDQEHHRVAKMRQWKPAKGEQPTPFTLALLNDKHSVQALAFLNSGRHRTDATESYKAEIGGGGGISNGRSLAGMYTPLANKGVHKGVRLLSADHITRMSQVSVATMEDATLMMPTRFGLGFMRSMDNRHRPTGDMESCIIGEHAFGHAGAGGSLGFADPEAELAFGYNMNRMGAGILLNSRGQSLVDATYQSLGYRSNTCGMWLR
ncbi:MAG: beta-lactamase family protein [Pseudomonadales bacterium]|nr:beta-lactamase family protein [Pseudomonadales bacterium]